MARKTAGRGRDPRGIPLRQDRDEDIHVGDIRRSREIVEGDARDPLDIRELGARENREHGILRINQ